MSAEKIFMASNFPSVESRDNFGFYLIFISLYNDLFGKARKSTKLSLEEILERVCMNNDPHTAKFFSANQIQVRTILQLTELIVYDIK